MSVVSLEGEAFQPPDIRFVAENGQVDPVELPNAAFAPSRKLRNVPQSRLATCAMAGYPEAFSNARGTPWQRGGHLEYRDRQMRADAQARHRCPCATERHSGYARIALPIKPAEPRVDDPEILRGCGNIRSFANEPKLGEPGASYCLFEAMDEFDDPARDPGAAAKTWQDGRIRENEIDSGFEPANDSALARFANLTGNELRNERWKIAEKES